LAIVDGLTIRCSYADELNHHCAPYGFQPSGFVAFTLGQPFLVDMIQVYGGTIGAGLDGTRAGDGVLRFRILEQDKTTPVAFTPVPEPITIIMIGPALAALWWARCRRQRRR
jgi:hypothetical protein